MATPFQNRIFGCVIVKSINSNYNADFSHQPRTLPDGTVYATDKVLKYSVRNWLKKTSPSDKVFYFKTLSDEMQPRDLGETYINLFGDFPKNEGKDKDVKNRKEVLKNLLTCIDVRLFGGTFAQKDVSLSLHGTTQITHGINRFPDNAIYSEQIASPFRNANDKSADSMQTTLGTQFKLREGHYVHHFSVNPQNLTDLVTLSGGESLNDEDIAKLKAGLSRGVTLYDSSAKAGTENELLLWVQLKPGSKLVLPSFVERITIADDEKRTIDLSELSAILAREHVKAAIERIEIYYDKTVTTVKDAPAGAIFHEIHQ
ncbi:MAG TPA: type I CRISPR-associated protein Cas7 [Saprospiraceae bacterium]|nr:type I CRISPR-associated protein Cas7 [Saprospiraceae bacterium]HND87325.1 type I CRISPR-associated protein Cas7 [Saprospiraceae bacterium]